MKGLFYVVALLLSLPNLIAGTASLLLKHTFATHNPLQIVTDFLFQVVWGLPLAGLLFLFLLVFGILSNTRPYTALFGFVLNTIALTLGSQSLGFRTTLTKQSSFSESSWPWSDSPGLLIQSLCVTDSDGLTIDVAHKQRHP